MNVGPGNYSERVIREVFFPPFARGDQGSERARRDARLRRDRRRARARRTSRSCRTSCARNGASTAWSCRTTSRSSSSSRCTHVVDSDAAAARLALESGVDLELPDPKLYPLLAAQVKSKAIPMALIDKAVARVLRAKFELGLFEQPYVDVEQADKIAGSAEHAALARKAADRSIVLLKNAGGLLPLDRAKVKTIAVIGPNAEPCRLGGYSGVPKRCIGVLRGIKEAVGSGREGDVGAGLRDHARVRLVGRQGRDVDARGGPPHDRRRGRGRAQGGRGRAGAGRQRAELARGVGAEPPGRSPEPGSAGAAGRPRARDPRARQADGRRAAQRPPAVDQPARAAGGRDPRGLLPGPGGRRRRRRRAVRRREPGRQAAGQLRALGRPPAGLLQPQAERAARLPVRRRHAALPVRPRPVVHDVRLQEPEGHAGADEGRQATRRRSAST